MIVCKSRKVKRLFRANLEPFLSCLEEAWNKYHKVLCHVDPNHPLKVLDDLWRPLHYPPETTSIGKNELLINIFFIILTKMNLQGN